MSTSHAKIKALKSPPSQGATLDLSFLRALIGIGVLFSLAFLISTNRKAINLRTVGSAFLLQVFLAALVLYFEPGRDLLYAISQGVGNVIAYGSQGISFIFGPEIAAGATGSVGFVFAFMVLPMIVFISSLIAVLYYVGIMTWIIRLLGGALQKITGTSRPESLSATANIFVGQTEAPMVVRPFLATMTRSELFAVMVGGLSTVAGSIIAGLLAVGIELKYLIAASFMAAPGSLMMAKIVLPETQQTINDTEELDEPEDKPVNVIDAAAAGAASGMTLAINVGAMVLAFVALIALINGFLGAFGGAIGINEAIGEPLTLNLILGTVFQPIAWIIGVPWSEAHIAGSFIGQKIVINEFVAYLDFVQVKESLSQSTQVIVTFALCGFANFSSIAILVGGIGGMAPNRRHEIAELGLRAVFAATLANLMSATLAGIFTAII